MTGYQSKRASARDKLFDNVIDQLRSDLLTSHQSKRTTARDKLTDAELFDQVIDQLRSDIEWRDFTAIEELLKFVPRENLIAFIKEDV
jgi:hypothetical protein